MVRAIQGSHGMLLLKTQMAVMPRGRAAYMVFEVCDVPTMRPPHNATPALALLLPPVITFINC